jgi:predicted PurR-regulated permease PerM
MVFEERDLRRISAIALVLLLGVLVILLIKPVFLMVMGGLILAYLFNPVNRLVGKIVKEKNTSAAIVTMLSAAIILVPLWFVFPIIIEQLFQIIKSSQEFNLQAFLHTLLPTASEQVLSQLSITIGSGISKITSSLLSSLVDSMLNIPDMLMGMLIIGFVFFFTLRDSEQLKEFVSGILPLNKVQQTILAKQFTDMTDSLIYGTIILGVLQGIFAGIGFLLFDIPNALTLTIFAIILGVLPIFGPIMLWVPIAIVMLASGNYTLGIGYAIYNSIFTSGMETVLRPYIISQKTDLPQVMVLIGMIGGIFVFGVFGLLIGPLILAYFLTLLKAYREKSLASIFSE